MDEFFLQYLWKYQKFQSGKLLTSAEKEVSVFHPGIQNHDSGPDFSEAKIKIDELIWSGSVEIHYRSSDWYRHKHQHDEAYENVILHVVWKEDKPVTNRSGSKIPTLELYRYSLENLADSYRHYINQPHSILCQNYLKTAPSIQIFEMMDKAYASRLNVKSDAILDIHSATNGNWEETTFRLITKFFGFKINNEAFEKLARSIPYKIIKKHLDHPQQIEALLFGMAGMLENSVDDYGQTLLKEFEFLKAKYDLTPLLNRSQWKFARSRPANFPTVRIAQLVGLLLSKKQLFMALINVKHQKEAKSYFTFELPEYWKSHYDFSKKTTKPYALGQSSIDLLSINCIAPLQVAYGRFVDNQEFIDQASLLLESLPAEKNRYIKKWKSLEVVPENAKDSQALLYQYHSMCKSRRCLACNIGVSIIG